MPTNAQDARALTYLACRLRKETHGACEWDDAGTHAVISELIGHNLAITVERVTRHAADPDAKTPGAIKRPFVPTGTTPGPRFPAKVGTDCRIHPGEHADSCRGCAADRLAGDRTARPAARSDDVAAKVTHLRQNVVPLRPQGTKPEPEGDESA